MRYKYFLVGIICFVLGGLYGVYLLRVGDNMCQLQWDDYPMGGIYQTFVDCEYPDAKYIFDENQPPTGFWGTTTWKYLTFVYRTMRY